MVFNSIGGYVLEVGTVGDVHVDKEFGHPLVVEFEPGAHFGGVGLEEVTIEVELLSGISCAQLGGTVLVDAVCGAEILVSIYVEDGYKEEAHIVEQLNILPSDNHITNENHRCILAVRLARVNTRLNEDYGAALLADLFGVLQTILVENDCYQIASLRALSECRKIYHRRVVGQFLEVGHSLLCLGCLHKIGLLDQGNKFFGRWFGCCARCAHQEHKRADSK